jgi:hypothetical protein
VPKSAEAIRPQALAGCWALRAVAFEVGSGLRQLGRLAFSETALGGIALPRSILACFKNFSSFQKVNSLRRGG